MVEPTRGVTVLHVVLSLHPGGAERLVVDMALRAGPHVRPAVCCLDEPGAWAAGLERREVPVIVLGRKPGFHPGLGVRLGRAARTLGAEVLHCHQYTPFVYGVLATWMNPALRLVFTEHGRLANAPPSPRRRLANALLGRARGRMFAVSQELKTFLETEGFPRDRLSVLPNGIDPGPRPAAERRAEARARLRVPHDVPLLGTAARLDPVKDLTTLVAALDDARRKCPGARLIVLGEGPERGRIEAEIAERGLQGSVTLAGHRADVRDLLPAFDLYVNCSTYEGVSLTILEAMAAGVPVLATRVGGTPEVVDDGVTGRLVPPGDATALADALAALLADPDRRARWGAAGRTRVEEHFDFESMMTMYRRAYGAE